MSRPPTLTERTTAALAEALASAGVDAWQQSTAQAMVEYIATELICLEQMAGRPLSLQDGVAHLLQDSAGEPEPDAQGAFWNLALGVPWAESDDA